MKTKRIVSFVLCLVVVLTLTVSAYAIGFTAKRAVFVRRGHDTSQEIIGQLNSGDVFWLEGPHYGSGVGKWYRGYPVSGNLYDTFGEVRGYAAAYGEDDGLANFW